MGIIKGEACIRKLGGLSPLPLDSLAHRGNAHGSIRSKSQALRDEVISYNIYRISLSLSLLPSPLSFYIETRVRAATRYNRDALAVCFAVGLMYFSEPRVRRCTLRTTCLPHSIHFTLRVISITENEDLSAHGSTQGEKGEF